MKTERNMSKSERIGEEITKTKAKISDLQTRLKELERQRIEAENSEMVMLIRDASIMPENFKEFINVYIKQTNITAIRNEADEAVETGAEQS